MAVRVTFDLGSGFAIDSGSEERNLDDQLHVQISLIKKTVKGSNLAFGLLKHLLRRRRGRYEASAGASTRGRACTFSGGSPDGVHEATEQAHGHTEACQKAADTSLGDRRQAEIDSAGRVHQGGD